jgi:lysine-specific demethylase 3
MYCVTNFFCIKTDIDIWMPNPENPPEELPLIVCKQLISQLGDQVCGMVQEENNALKIEASFEDKNIPIAWKRLVEGVREMCDVCATTLFNYHWICESCGFVACLACFKSRMDGVRKV